MKIKLAILEKDVMYLKRIINTFTNKYSDKFEIYSFTDKPTALSSLETNRIDILVASDAFSIEQNELPSKCGFAYFVDTADVETVKGQKAIGKFQKVDLIYKQFLSLYSDKSDSVSSVKFGDEDTKLVMFTSPCGGTGTSSSASAYASRLAMMSKKVLYLNAEKFGSSDVFFKADGQFDMSDIIYAIKSKKSNLSMKIQSCVRQSADGVFYFSQSKVALDMFEMKIEDFKLLFNEIKLIGFYDYVIVDIDFSLDAENIDLWKTANSLVWVGDGHESSNSKIARAFNALCIMEQNSETAINSRIYFMYNKFSNKIGSSLGDIGLRIIGGAPRYEHANSVQVVEQLRQLDIFDKII